MARESKGPKYYKSRGGYYTSIKNKKVCLAMGAKDDPLVKKLAWEEWANVRSTADHNPEKANPTVAYVFDEFLIANQKDFIPERLELIKRIMCEFARKNGNVKVAELTYRNVVQYIDEASQMKVVEWTNPLVKGGKCTRLTKVGEAGIRQRLGILNQIFKWAIQPPHKIIEVNPMQGMKLPSAKSRGEDAVISDKDMDRLEAGINLRGGQRFKDLLVILRRTGARPSEIYLSQIDEYIPEKGILHIKNHKTKRKGYKRVIVLDDVCVAIIERRIRRAKDRGTKRLFCLEKVVESQRPLGGVQGKFRKLRKRLGLPKTITMYSYRHTYATNWLLKGGSIAILAQQLGHTSTAMIEKHYGHLIGRDDAIRQEMERMNKVEPKPHPVVQALFQPPATGGTAFFASF